MRDKIIVSVPDLFMHLTKYLPMPFFRALGFVILIIAIRLIVPTIYQHIERTAIAFLDGATASALTASAIASSIHPSSSGMMNQNQPLMLPQAPLRTIP